MQQDTGAMTTRVSDDDSFPDEQADEARRQEFAALLSGITPPKVPDVGAIVEGIVVQISETEVFLDIGAKSEALIDRAELTGDDGELEVEVGGKVEASVLSNRDDIRLSRKMLKSAKSQAALADAHASGLPVEGRVESVRKGGFEISLPGNSRGFCPLSQIDDRRVAQPEEWVGRNLDFRIIEMGPRGRNVVVSRRRLLEEAAALLAEETRKKLHVGVILEGEVRSLKGYGAFVDIGGVQGLLHVSEISHTRLDHPSQALKVGDQVKVEVLRLDDESGKISLGMKNLTEDPWNKVADKLPSGTRVEGKVARVAEFGAFVELLPGIDGLVHVSELDPSRRARDARTLVRAGDDISVQVLEIDLAKRRISLGRIASEEEETPVDLIPGTVVEGKVARVEPFGVFVRLGPGATGLVPNEEMGTERGADHRSMFASGDAMKVEILSIEEDGKRIRLSRTRVMDRFDRDEVDRYRGRGDESGEGFSTLGDAFRKARE